MITVRVIEDSPMKIKVLSEMVQIPTNPYEGEYEITPTQETQTLLTANKQLSENIIVHPIPNNYGLITYNGYEITVS